MLGRVPVAPQLHERVNDGFARLADHVRTFDPDIVIQFAPDHFQGFYYRLMPSFCVGLAARSAEDWDIRPGKLNVPQSDAKALISRLQDDDFDVAISRDMVVDHGFLQMWQEMLGDFSTLPIIPIFVNCAAAPLPRYRRIRMLGEAVGRFAAESGKKILIVASGGLSHDPPVPDIENIPDAVRERLINGIVRNASEKAAHEESLMEFGRLAGKGEGPCRPLNPTWDRTFLDILASGNLQQLDDFDEASVREVAGRAGNEVLAWVAACSALAASGPYDMKVEFYEPIADWIAGMAMIVADSR
tara:strand:+ start:1147 stop:2049 length:903 start_codon:yes stop_codon:yes gene_type:complete